VSGELRRWVRQDWDSNEGRPESKIVLASLRLAQWAWTHESVWWRRPALIWHRWFIGFVIGVDIPPQVQIGPGLQLYHPAGIVLQSDVSLGSGCILRHHVTIGSRTSPGGKQGPSPRIGDGVEFGVGSSVLGDIHIGDAARIGAHALVLHNVPDRVAVGGNPAVPLHGAHVQQGPASSS
jgi:serine acetyltransferase